MSKKEKKKTPVKKGEIWMQPPSRPDGCPPGLEYLINLDQVEVCQAIELLEVLCSCETKNKYYVSNKDGHKMWYMMEDSNICLRLCFGKRRAFRMDVTDANDNAIMHFERPCKIILSKMRIYDSTGKQLGTIAQHYTFCRPLLSVRDEKSKKIFYIRGPSYLLMSCRKCCTVKFRILQTDKKTEVGIISKKFGGLVKELFTQADTYCATFPKDLDVKMKALLVGALLLVDYLYFEK